MDRVGLEGSLTSLEAELMRTLDKRDALVQVLKTGEGLFFLDPEDSS